jgi:ABC-type Zn uptake system ZnuABC Zn-binding protein ZnuA
MAPEPRQVINKQGAQQNYEFNGPDAMAVSGADLFVANGGNGNRALAGRSQSRPG